METVEQNRKSRTADTREVAFKRPEAWRPPETLPTPDERPGWKHRWVRLSTMDYPELMMHAATEGRFKGGIEVGGLLLCRIPEEFLQQRASFYEGQNKAQMESVDNNFLRENDPRMPLFSEKKTKVTFGSGS
jgi:hypothetical protein